MSLLLTRRRDLQGRIEYLQSVINALKDGFEERGRLIDALARENTQLRDQIQHGTYLHWPVALDATITRH